MENCKLLLVLSCLVSALGPVAVNGEIKTFRSPMFSLSPGEVANSYFRIEMPSGHVGLKSFNGDVVDENGNSVPLSEVYLHHWVANKLHVRKDVSAFGRDYIVPNAGICQAYTLPQFYGLGSETRRTEYFIPEPYVIEIGNPKEIPDGYEETWSLNVHAIDTRGAVNPMHCLECRCASYNVSNTEYGKKVPEEYVGGLECCLDGYQCAVKEGFQGMKKNLYFQYTVEYFPMAPPLKPVRVYITDVTDDRTAPTEKPRCQVEYDVVPCDKSKDITCRQEQNALVWLPEKEEVNVIYVTGHLHAGGLSLGLRGEDGREICTSNAMYGTGHEAGNEAGYIVGMSSCYPADGSVRIKPGETLHSKAVYDSEEFHTGVMGLMYILVADPVSNDHDSLTFWTISGVVVVVAIAVAIIGFSVTRYVQMKRRNMGYETLVQA